MTVRVDSTAQTSEEIKPEDSGSITNAITRALQTAMSEPDLEITLYDHIEPEALDRLVEHSAANGSAVWEVGFTVEEWFVSVSSDGEVTVTEKDAPAREGR